jgi:hypothetical protein
MHKNILSSKHKIVRKKNAANNGSKKARGMNNQTHQNAQRNLNWQGWQILFPAASVQKFFSITSITRP